MKAFIGTSGWQYRHWRDRVYPRSLPQKDWLKFFSKRFDTVEINTSFYHLPTTESFKRWGGEVKENKNFVFSVKLYRLFTHYKRLKLDDKDTVEYLKLFLTNMKALGRARGPLLIQLPPSMKCDLERLGDFLVKLKKIHNKISRNNKYCIEFRHISWFTEEVYAFLKKHKVALVGADSPRWPMRVLKTADFAYLRLHGSQKLYASEYSERELREWWYRIQQLKAKAAYVYFDNDGHAFAVKNARFLKLLAE